MHEKISGMNDFYYLIPVAFLDSASSLAFLMHTQARVGAVSCRVKASSDGGLSEGASEDTSTSESPTLRDRMAPDDRHESDGLRVSIPLLSLGGDSSARWPWALPSAEFAAIFLLPTVWVQILYFPMEYLYRAVPFHNKVKKKRPN